MMMRVLLDSLTYNQIIHHMIHDNNIAFFIHAITLIRLCVSIQMYT